jgi:TonB family protein
VSLRREELEEQYDAGVSSGLVIAVVLHAAIAFIGGLWLNSAPHRLDEERLTIGYEGTQTLQEIEIVLPRSVQSYFSQRERLAESRAHEYKVLDEIEIEPGPEPIPVARRDPEPDPEIDPSLEDVDLVQPLVPTHRPLSYSQNFVILQAVKPEYPEYERAHEIEAELKVAFYVTREGRIDNIEVTDARTWPPGASSRAFELAVVEAVEQWRVLPPVRDGERRGASMYIRWRFDLNDVEAQGTMLEATRP